MFAKGHLSKLHSHPLRDWDTEACLSSGVSWNKISSFGSLGFSQLDRFKRLLGSLEVYKLELLETKLMFSSRVYR